jgi:periodic tryptophan protein 1
MISAVHWMPRGRAKAAPVPYEPTPEEMEEMRLAAQALKDQEDNGVDEDEDDWEDASSSEDEGPRGKKGKKSDAGKEAGKAARKAANAMQNADDDDLAIYNLDNYDDEPDRDFVSGLTAFKDNKSDPYITVPDEEDDSGADDDNLIRPTDDVILTCHSEEMGHTLEVYVYDQAMASLFVHHDLMLNAFPLCVEWLDCARSDGQSGSYAAIGTMDTEIEVWDLDCIDSMLPVAVLGGEVVDGQGAAAQAKSKGKKKKKGAAKVYKEGSHRDAVLGLCWHRLQRHVLGSCSADKTVKIWDVPHEKCLHTLSHHTDKVQALQWHPTDAATLLTGSFDQSVSVCDVRAVSADWKAATKWKLSSDVECISWDPHNHSQFLCSTDQGEVTCHDMRKAGQGPLFTIGAHAEACTGLAVNPLTPGLLATASLDRTVKLWDIRGGKVSYIASKSMQCGQVFSISWSPDPDSGYTLACGGKDAKLNVWNTAASAAVRAAFNTGKTAEDFDDEEELGMGKMKLDDDDEADPGSSDPDVSDEEEYIEMPTDDGYGDDEGEGGEAGGDGKKKKKKKKDGSQTGGRVLPMPKKIGSKKKDKK